jgi:hypothetical protein
MNGPARVTSPRAAAASGRQPRTTDRPVLRCAAAGVAKRPAATLRTSSASCSSSFREHVRCTSRFAEVPEERVVCTTQQPKGLRYHTHALSRLSTFPRNLQHLELQILARCARTCNSMIENKFSNIEDACLEHESQVEKPECELATHDPGACRGNGTRPRCERRGRRRDDGDVPPSSRSGHLAGGGRAARRGLRASGRYWGGSDGGWEGRAAWRPSAPQRSRWPAPPQPEGRRGSRAHTVAPASPVNRYHLPPLLFAPTSPLRAARASLPDRL